MVRKAIESLYRDTCTVIARESYVKPNQSTAFRERILIENQPCKISYAKAISTQPTTGEGVASDMKQDVKLFISPDIRIPPGCKIIVTHFGIPTAYRGSGVPTVFAHHQEIRLELFDKWA